MTHKALLKLLVSEGIDFVLIGGVALRMYNSGRVTHDIDLAIRTLDVDAVIGLMYGKGYTMVTGADEDAVTSAESEDDASFWVEETKSGAISFIERPKGKEGPTVPMEGIDISSQVDFLFELAIPVMRLKQNARIIEMGDFSFPVASVEDLITLKQHRAERDDADDYDIRFLKSLQ